MSLAFQTRSKYLVIDVHSKLGTNLIVNHVLNCLETTSSPGPPSLKRQRENALGHVSPKMLEILIGSTGRKTRYLPEMGNFNIT